jgi:hypothetical protein
LHRAGAAAKVAVGKGEPAQGGGGCETSGGAAGSRSFAPCGRVYTRTLLGGGQRLGKGSAARWIMATAACIIGAALAAVQIHIARVQAEHGGVLAAHRERAAAGLRRGARVVRECSRPQGAAVKAAGPSASHWRCAGRSTGFARWCLHRAGRPRRSRRDGANQRRGTGAKPAAGRGEPAQGDGCETSGGAAGSRSFAPCGRVHTRTLLGGGQRAETGQGQGSALDNGHRGLHNWGRHWWRYKYIPRGCRQSTVGHWRHIENEPQRGCARAVTRAGAFSSAGGGRESSGSVRHRTGAARA